MTEGRDGYCAYRKQGSLVCVVCDYLQVTAGTTKTLGTLPAGFRPSRTVLGMGYPRGVNNCGQVSVSTDGRVQIWCAVTSPGYFGGSVTFPLA